MIDFDRRVAAATPVKPDGPVIRQTYENPFVLLAAVVDADLPTFRQKYPQFITPALLQAAANRMVQQDPVSIVQLSQVLVPVDKLAEAHPDCTVMTLIKRQ